MQDYVLIFLYSLISLVSGDMGPSFNFEQRSYIGPNPNDYRRVGAHAKSYDVSQLNKMAHPEPLPRSSPSYLHPSPYDKIIQGKRYHGRDKRVFTFDLDYEPKAMGQIVSSNKLFDCILSHVSVETERGIPIILRGGVNYRYFNIIIKVKPGDSMTGKIKAYCLKTQNDLDEEQQKKTSN